MDKTNISCTKNTPVGKMDYFDGLTIASVYSIPHHAGIIVNKPQYYSIQFNYNSSFFLKVGNRREQHVRGSFAFFTYPGEQFTYGPSGGKNTRHHCFVCTCGPRIRKYLESGLFFCDPEDPLIPIANSGVFLQHIEQLTQCCRENGGSGNPRAVLMFEDLLLRIHEARQYRKSKDCIHTRKLQEIAERITADPGKEYDFSACAEECGITLIHFRRIFKEHTGFPPQQYLIRMRLQKAAELLVSTPLAVKSIAYRLGWEDEYYFSRLFREKYRIPPRQYRKGGL